MIDVLYSNRASNRSGGEFRSEFIFYSFIDYYYIRILVMRPYIDKEHTHHSRHTVHTFYTYRGRITQFGLWRDKESNTDLPDAKRR